MSIFSCSTIVIEISFIEHLPVVFNTASSTQSLNFSHDILFPLRTSHHFPVVFFGHLQLPHLHSPMLLHILSSNLQFFVDLEQEQYFP